MREGRPRAVRSRPGPLTTCASALAGLALSASGCATEVNTFPESLAEDPSGGSGGTASVAGYAGSGVPAGGKAPVAGSKSNGGAGGSGGTGVSAFGGTNTTGGKPQGGAPSAGGTSAGSSQAGGSPEGGASQGGAIGAGGKGGAGVGVGGKGGTSQGGSTAAAGNGGSAGGTPVGCLKDWKGGVCDTCSAQTQSDKLACVKILDCYAVSSCGPASCGTNNDDKCGANKIGQGTAGYPIAKDVYDCACQ